MTLLWFPTDEGYNLDGHLCRATAFQDDVGMGIDKVPADGTAKKSSCDQGIRVTEGMSAIELFLQVSLASRATKLPIESPERLGFGIESIFVPFNGFPGENRIELFVNGHGQKIELAA